MSSPICKASWDRVGLEGGCIWGSQLRLFAVCVCKQIPAPCYTAAAVLLVHLLKFFWRVCLFLWTCLLLFHTALYLPVFSGFFVLFWGLVFCVCVCFKRLSVEKVVVWLSKWDMLYKARLSAQVDEKAAPFTFSTAVNMGNALHQILNWDLSDICLCH